MADKEQWKDDVMGSIRGIQRAEPGPFLFTRIEEQLKRRTYSTDRIIALPKLSLAIIGMALLFMFNFLVLRNSVSGNNLQSSSGLQEYSLISTHYNLY